MSLQKLILKEIYSCWKAFFLMCHWSNMCIGAYFYPKTKKLNPYLLGGQTPHVCHFDDVLQELGEVWDVGVDGHLVLPLKLCPHLSELRVVAGGGHDVVHDVDVNVIQDHAVSVAARTTHVVHCQKRQVFCSFIVYVDLSLEQETQLNWVKNSHMTKTHIVKKLYESLGVENYSEYNIFKNKLSAYSRSRNIQGDKILWFWNIKNLIPNRHFCFC